MSGYDYDLFVIGAGSGGVRAARIAASHGAKVAIAEEYRVGGTCVIRGCVPKKLLVYGSQFGANADLARAYGWSHSGMTLDWPTLRDAVQSEVTRLEGLYTQTLAKHGVTTLPHRAKLRDAHSVEVDGKIVTADKILIATGARPVLPDAPGAELGITSNEVFTLKELPKRLLIAGGGYIATEFAGIFHGLGSKVTQLYRGETILKEWDDELRTRLQQRMIESGITLHTKAIFERIEKSGSALVAHLSDGASVEADVILYAIGRKPNIRGLGLEHAGVELGKGGAIEVNDWSQTNVPNIYAVGDVTDRIQLTPVAIREGHGFADSVFGGNAWHADWSNVPSAVFSQPPLAAVGMSEKQALAAGHEVKIYRSAFRPMRTALAGLPHQSFCKLVVDTKTDRVLGAHMLGEDAPEIIQALAIAVKMGATKAQFDATVALHPSAAEEFVLMR